MILEEILIIIICKEESVECNSISDTSTDNIEDDTKASCVDSDENSIASSICDGTSVQTDWRLLWWRYLDNFDEVISLSFLELN